MENLWKSYRFFSQFFFETECGKKHPEEPIFGVHVSYGKLWGNLQVADEICHLDAGASNVVTLVASLGACALDSLLDGVRGNDAE